MKYGMTDLKVLAVVKPQTDTTAVTPARTTFGDLMQRLDIVPGQSQMLQVISRLGHSRMRLGLEKSLPHSYTAFHMPNSVPNLSQVDITKPTEP
jgi:hypothetical protein